MHIDSIELFHLALPLRQLLSAPKGPLEKLETVVVAMHSGGATGWGEGSPGNAPLAGVEWAAGVFAVLRDWFAPALVGQNSASAEELANRLSPFRGNQHAKAAIDAAWWDLSARLRDVPLYRLLASGEKGAIGPHPTNEAPAIEVGPTLDKMESVDRFMTALADAVAAGFARVKLKFRPGWDVRMVEAVRREHPLLTFHIDCEGALRLGQMDMLYRLEDFSLAMIEQPLPADDLVGHAMLQDSLRTPVCLDEGIATVAQADMAIELKSCKYVNLKPGRVGGLTPAIAIHDLCHDACTPCWVGATPQSAIAARIGFSLAALRNCTYPADFFPSDQVLAEDIAEPLLPAKDARDGVQRVQLWSAPGIGAEPDRKLLEKFSLVHITI